MFKDKDKNFCLAKTSFGLTLLVMLYTIIDNPSVVDYQGMAMFLGAVGAVYYGRSDSKDKKRDPL